MLDEVLIYPRQESLTNQCKVRLPFKHPTQRKHRLLGGSDIHRDFDDAHAPLGDFSRRSVMSLTPRRSASSWSFCWSCTCNVPGPSQKVGMLPLVVVQISAMSIRPPMIAPALSINVTSPLATAMISASTVANWFRSSASR